MKLLGMGVFLVAALSQSATAGAEPKTAQCDETPSPEAVEEAKNSFHRGEKAFQEAAYGQAIELWSDAYKNDCTAHALLLNLATAQELHHNLRQAIHSLRLFNRRKPQSPYVEPNFKRIIRLEDQITKQVQEDEEVERRRLEAAQNGLSEAPPSATDQSSSPKLIPLVMMSGGALTALAGLGIYYEAQSAESEAQEACAGNRTRCEDFSAVLSGESARSRVALGGMLAAGGVALASAGLLLHWLGNDEPNQDHKTLGKIPTELQWTAVGSERSLGLQLRGRF